MKSSIVIGTKPMGIFFIYTVALNPTPEKGAG